MTHAPRRRATGRLALSLLAVGLVGAGLPLGTAGTAGAEEAPAFTGFSTFAWAAPVHVQVYEPTIPIPATPQLEFMLGYSKVEADSSSSRGRASWMWPGDPVGEGAKTFVEALGLPPQLGENGYPVQVNSSTSGETQQSDEPFPGMVMRTSAGPERTMAATGFSPDGQLQDPGSGGGDDGEGDGDGDGGGGGAPGLPGLPGAPEIPGLAGVAGLGGILGGLGGAGGGSGQPDASQLLSDFGAAITGGSVTAATEEPEEQPPGGGSVPGLPPELAALIDFAGYVSTSETVATDQVVRTVSRSALGEVSLLGGTITMEGIASKAVTVSDGAKGQSSGRTAYGSMTIAGTEFAMGPKGFTAAGSTTAIPGLPDDPAKALATLGVSITMPKPELVRDGDKAISTVPGLVVELDLKALKEQLSALPLQDIVAQIPAEAGELKKLLQTAVGLAPRIVLHLGTSSGTVDTVQGIEIPIGDIPDNDPGGEDDTSSGDGDVDTSGGVDSDLSGGSDVPTSDPGSVGGDGDGGDGVDPLIGATPVGAGLPPLFSIPGFLLVAAIAAAAVAGSWFRKLGVLALGAGAPCPHGLDSGLPDLRKA